MKTLETINHKKNEIQEVEFFKDAECTEDFDFMDKKDLYIGGLNGDITPLVRLRNQAATWQNIYTPYLCEQFKYYEPLDKIKTLNDITPNLSKYIPEDNAVLFLSEEDMKEYKDCFPNSHVGLYINDGKNDEVFIANNTESLINGVVEVKKGNTIIFLEHGTKSETQKAEEVAKHLWKNFGIKPNLYVLHWFFNYDGHIESDNTFCKGLSDTALEEDVCCTSAIRSLDDYEECLYINNINKIITTNSTGILKPEDSTERLQVIDAKEIFEEYLNGNNLID